MPSESVIVETATLACGDGVGRGGLLRKYPFTKINVCTCKLQTEVRGRNTSFGRVVQRVLVLRECVVRRGEVSGHEGVTSIR